MTQNDEKILIVAKPDDAGFQGKALKGAGLDKFAPDGANAVKDELLRKLMQDGKDVEAEAARRHRLMRRIFLVLVAICVVTAIANAEVPDFLPRLTRNTSDMIFNGIRETPRDYYHVLAGVEMYEDDDLYQERPIVTEGRYEYARRKECIDLRLDFRCLKVSGGCNNAYLDYIFSSDDKVLQKVVMTITCDKLSILEEVYEDFFWTAHCLTDGLVEREEEPHCWEGDDVVIYETAESEKFVLPSIAGIEDAEPVMLKYAFSMTVSFPR